MTQADAPNHGCPQPAGRGAAASRERRQRPGTHHPHPGGERGAHDLATSSPGAARASPKPGAWARSSSSTARPTAPPRSRSAGGAVSCARRSGASVAPTSTPCPTSAVATSSWVMPTAPTTSGSSRRSSRRCATATSSRWAPGGAGSIEPGSMPGAAPVPRHPGHDLDPQPLYGSHFTDIHCGMRGITREALVAHGPRSQSWEYASEMVLKSVRMGLKTVEVPVTFYKDRDGRLSPPQALRLVLPVPGGWINLRAMFIYGAEFFAAQARLRASLWAWCSPCRSASARSRSARSPSASTGCSRDRAVGGRAAELLLRMPGPHLPRLHRPEPRTITTIIRLHQSSL